MESWGVFFLGVIALASVVQAGFLLGLVFYGRRLAQRVDALQVRLDREISPALENFNRVSRAAAEIADLATLQARRLDLLLADTIDKVEETTATIQQFVVRPLKPIGGVVAFLKGLQRGMDVYFKFDRSAPPRRRVPGEDDEHLFHLRGVLRRTPLPPARSARSESALRSQPAAYQPGCCGAYWDSLTRRAMVRSRRVRSSGAKLRVGTASDRPLRARRRIAPDWGSTSSTSRQGTRVQPVRVLSCRPASTASTFQASRWAPRAASAAARARAKARTPTGRRVPERATAASAAAPRSAQEP